MRAFTEHFRATEWVVLYHNQIIAESYWYPLSSVAKKSKPGREERKNLLHDQYPNFFKLITSIQENTSTTVAKLGTDEKTVLKEFFASVNDEDSIGVMRATKEKGKKQSATILYKNKSIKAISSRSSNSIHEVHRAEKKVLQKIVYLLSNYLQQQQDRLMEQIQYRWNSHIAPTVDSHFYKNNTTSQSHLKHFIHGIKSGLDADDFQLYWVSGEFYPLKSASSTNSSVMSKPEELDARRLILKNNFNIRQKVKVRSGQNLTVHSKIEVQLKPVLSQPYPTLWLMVSFNEKQQEHILGHSSDKVKNPGGSHLVVEFVRSKSKSWFNDLDIGFAAYAQEKLAEQFLKSVLLNDLRDVVRQQLKSVTEPGGINKTEEIPGITTLTTSVVDEPSLYHIQPENYSNYELVYAQRKFSTNRFMALDKKTDHRYFYFGDLSALDNAESYFVIAGFDYLQNETLDILDLAKQFIHLTDRVKKPIGYGIVDFPNSIHFSKVKKSDNSANQLGLLGNGVNFYRYSFETGKLKALISFPQRVVIELNPQDLVIALPKPVSMNQSVSGIGEGVLRKLEKELVIWGHSDANELAKVVGNSVDGRIPHFVLVRKTG